MRRYHLPKSFGAPGRRRNIKSVSCHCLDPLARVVVRFPKRLRRPPPRVRRPPPPPPPVDATSNAMEAERFLLLDDFFTEWGHDRSLAQHLVVMVNGLNGAPGNWNVLKKHLISSLDGPACQTVFFASHANRRLQTFGGICSCAGRLSDELLEVIKSCPNLEEISFLVHSMGGLISRYACGAHYDPEKKTIFGLKPRHYISIASPHLGCALDGEAQVPLLLWSRVIPLLGTRWIRPLFSRIAPFFVSRIYRRTGRQLFLMDGKLDGDQIEMPLLCRLVHDLPDEGYFLSALRSFQSRTCYANVQQDALVSWANASLRRLPELPVSVDQRLLSSSVSCRMDTLRQGLWTNATPEAVDLSAGLPENWKKKHAMMDFMLQRLQSMPWCRIDICFHGLFVPLLAHTHIQVTRRWLDGQGMPVVRHIADTYSKLNALVSESSH